MADGKKSIIVYADWMDKFEELTDDEAGRLIKHFFRFVNDLDPIAPDRTTKLMFIDIQNSLKRDLNKWENIKEKRSEAGKASAAAKKKAKLIQQKETKSTSVKKAQQTSTKSTVSDSVNVSVSDTVNNIVVEEEKKVFTEPKVSKIAPIEIEEIEVIAADVEIDEEEYAAAETYLKSQSRIYITLQSQQKITAAECLKLFRTFYEQKWGLEKSYSTGKEMIDNFFYWVPKHLQSTRPKKAPQNGNANTNTRTSAKGVASHVTNREERNDLVNGLKSLLLGTEPKQRA